MIGRDECRLILALLVLIPSPRQTLTYKTLKPDLSCMVYKVIYRSPVKQINNHTIFIIDFSLFNIISIS